MRCCSVPTTSMRRRRSPSPPCSWQASRPRPRTTDTRSMGLEVRPATLDRFDDVATMLGPKRPDASVCWCLSHRIDARLNRELVGPARAEHVRDLCSRDVAPGVLGYDGDAV